MRRRTIALGEMQLLYITTHIQSSLDEYGAARKAFSSFVYDLQPI